MGYLFDDFEKEKDVECELLNKYESVLPAELLNVWKEYGFGCFMNGYMKVINPSDYGELVKNTYFRGTKAIPMFVTAFADIIVWEENKYIKIIKYKNGIFIGMAAGFRFFFGDLAEKVFEKKCFDMDMYLKALHRKGKLKYDECFGYVPLLGLGGSEKVENLQIVKICPFYICVS